MATVGEEFRTWYMNCIGLLNNSPVRVLGVHEDDDMNRPFDELPEVNVTVEKLGGRSEVVPFGDLDMSLPECGFYNICRKTVWLSLPSVGFSQHVVMPMLGMDMACDSVRQYCRGFRTGRYSLSPIVYTTRREPVSVSVARNPGRPHWPIYGEALTKTYPGATDALSMVVAGDTVSAAVNRRWAVALNPLSGRIVLKYSGRPAPLATIDVNTGLPEQEQENRIFDEWKELLYAA